MFETVATGDLGSAGEVGIKCDLPCPVCGGRDYSWGSLSAHGVNFMPDDAWWLAKAFRWGVKLRARRCGSCGNLQAFA